MDDQLVDDPVEGQATLFGEDAYHRHHTEWQAMPPFEQDDQLAAMTVLVSFRNAEDRRAFFEKIEQSFTVDTKFIWFPKAERDEVADLRWRSTLTRPRVAPTTARARVTRAKPTEGGLL